MSNSGILSLADARRIQHAVQTGQPAPDGPVLEEWNALNLAQALEHECNRAGAFGLPKISLHMDVPDAMKLATVLRRISLKG